MPDPQTTSMTVADLPDETAADANPFGWRFMGPLLLGSSLNAVNASLLATAIVPISKGINESIGHTATLVTALYLASAVAQPTAGKAADVFGPRRVFLSGLVLCAVGGTVGGFAGNLFILLLARVLIGLGTSCAFPTAVLMIRRRALAVGMEGTPGRVLGNLQISALGTTALGLPIGGALISTLGWRSIFFINVPVAAIAFVTAVAAIPADPPLEGHRRARDVAAKLDLVGVAGFATAMTALLLFLFNLPDAHWWLLGLSLALWVLLVGWELRARIPFLDVRVLASNRALTMTYLRFGLALLCVYVVLYGITQWVETVRGLSPTQSGLLLLPMTVVSGIVIAPISRRNLVRGPVIASGVFCVASSFCVLALNKDAWIGWVVIITIGFGVVLGTTSVGNQIALYAQAPPEQLGTASGLLRTFGFTGSIASSAITGIVFHTHITDAGVHRIGYIMIGISAFLLLMTLADRTVPASAPH